MFNKCWFAFFFQKYSNIFEQIFFFEIVQIYMKDPKCAESKEKQKFKIFPILFFELWSFLWRQHSAPQFSMKFSR